MKKFLASALLLSCLLLPASLLAGELSIKTLVIALKPDKNQDKMLEDRKVLAEALKQKLGIEVKVVVPMSTAVILEGFANGSIDLGYLSSTGVAKAARKGEAELLLVGDREGQTHYFSVWLALREKDYYSVRDLAGKPVAYASRSSTSGFLIPTWDLYTKGLITQEGGPEGYFGKDNVYFGSGYVSAVERVLSGEAEAAAVSDYVIMGSRHLTPEQKSRLKIIDTQGPVPSHTLAVRSSLSEGDRKQVREALLALTKKEPELADKVFNGILREVDPIEHLATTNEALDMLEGLKY